MKIGITGGIGSGKSYICNILKSMGYPVYNCDNEAKRLMIENETIISSLRSLITQEDPYFETKEEGGDVKYRLNKEIVGNYLFADAENAQKVNAIVHPVVKEDFLQWAQNQQTPHVMMECAILFESGFDAVVDKSVLIYADEEKRLRRAMKRDNAAEEQIRIRMSQQISNEEAVKRADYILNHNDYDTTDDEIERLVNWLNNM